MRLHMLGRKNFSLRFHVAMLTGFCVFVGSVVSAILWQRVDESAQADRAVMAAESGLAQYLTGARRIAATPELLAVAERAIRGDGAELGRRLDSVANGLSAVAVSVDGRVLARNREGQGISIDAIVDAGLLQKDIGSGVISLLPLKSGNALAAIVSLRKDLLLVLAEPFDQFQRFSDKKQDDLLSQVQFGLSRHGRVLGATVDGLVGFEIDATNVAVSNGVYRHRGTSWTIFSAPSDLIPNGTQIVAVMPESPFPWVTSFGVSLLMASIAFGFSYWFASSFVRFPLRLAQSLADSNTANLDRRRVRPQTSEDEVLLSSCASVLQRSQSRMLEVEQGLVDFSQGLQEQIQILDGVQASMESIGMQAQAVSNNCGEVSASSSESSQYARSGGAIIGDTVGAIEHINQLIRDGATTVHELQKSSEEIGQIVSVINGIAEQTNLLALNASIEAARAGDTGKGFSVVADEVRNLAEETTRSTKAIANMIASIQRSSGESVRNMDQVHSETEKGVGLARDAGAALEKIVGQSETVSEQVRTISDGIGNLTSQTRKMLEELAELNGNLNLKLLGRLKSIQNRSNKSG